MKRRACLIAGLVVAVLATSCTVYKIKEMDAKALASKGKRGRIVSVQTAEGSVIFSEKDPAEVKDGVVLGSLRAIYTLDPFDIAEIATSPAGPKVVLKDGSRFRAAASKSVGEGIECEAVKTLCIPLDEVVRAKVRVKDAAASILGTLAGAVLVVGALAVDAATYDEENDEPGTTFTEGLIDSLVEGSPGAPARSGRKRSNTALIRMNSTTEAAAEKVFWSMEWTPVDARPGEDGKVRLRLGNPSGAPRGIDEAKLVVVDRMPGAGAAADVYGVVRAFAAPVAPDSAIDGSGQDVTELVSASDGALWRTAGWDPSAVTASPIRDEITVSFPKPKGARRAKLIVNAANSGWPAEFAREVRARQVPANPQAGSGNGAKTAASPYQEWEYGRVQARMLTVSGWQTGQVLFAVGPLPSADTIYNLDLSDVGTDKVWLKLAPPSGYWLIDRLALDFGADLPVETVEVAAEEADGPDAAAVLEALAAEDGTTLRLETADPPALLTFTLPPPMEGKERTVFLRTVSCYEMPPRDTHNP